MGLRRSPAAMVLGVLLAACGGGDKQVAANTQPLAPAEPAPPAAPAAQPQPAAPAPEQKPAPVYPKPGYTKVVLLDEQVPLCLFSSYEDWQKVEFLDQVKKPKLKAGQRLVFGAFGPWCMSELCDDRPLLQCRLETDDNTITVHAKYGGAHKDGATCTENCRKVTASCSTKEELPAGTYTVHYGTLTKQVKIPSLEKTPCFEVEHQTAP